MSTFSLLLLVTVFLSSLLTGFLFAFAVVVMPGIAKLSDGEFIRSFQAIDGVIQRNQPLFMVMWLGSILSQVLTTAVAFGELSGVPLWLMVGATAASILLIQLPTMRINIPLNNRLQRLETRELSDDELREKRAEFEPRWLWWNTTRTIVACGVTIVHLHVLLAC